MSDDIEDIKADIADAIDQVLGKHGVAMTDIIFEVDEVNGDMDVYVEFNPDDLDED